tara:strand:- start:2215 stop:3855 length:1641 start_codon:yes stop_codon:yes gene_type:complete
MADLSGQTIASSYEQLLSLPDGGGNANTLVAVTDGDGGTTFGIKLATNKVEIIPGSNDANAFEVSQADGTAVLTVNTSTAGATITGVLNVFGGGSDASTSANAYADNLVIRGSNDSNGSGITIFSEDDEFGTLYFGRGGSGADAYRGYVQYSHSADELQLGSDGSTRLIINDAGTVSVGSIADEGNAIITNGADAGRYDVLTIQENGNDRWELSFEGNGSTNSLTFGSNVSEQNIANGGVLTLLPDGQVGIGCSPDSKLKIQENTNGDNVAFSMRAFNDSGTGKAVTFTLDPDDESLTLTNLASFKIDQASTGQFGNTALQTVDGGDNGGVNIEHGAGDGRIRVASAGSFRTEYLANQLKANANGYDIRTTDSQNVTISTNNSTRMTVAGSNGDVTVNALLVAGSGVAIGGTGSANTLDDYEEGSYTPTSVTDSLTFSSATGNYTKIGRLCFVRIAVTYPTTTGSHLATPRISLPFTAISDGVNPIANVFPPHDDGATNAANGFIGRPNGNQAFVELIRKKEGSDADNSDLSGVSVAVTLWFTTTT